MGKIKDWAIEFENVQEDLNDHMEELTEIEINTSRGCSPLDMQVDVALLFTKMLVEKYGADIYSWDHNLQLVRLPRLRAIAVQASLVGLGQLAEIIRAHIKLRLAFTGKPRLTGVLKRNGHRERHSVEQPRTRFRKAS